jgi:hypothetical protein
MHSGKKTIDLDKYITIKVTFPDQVYNFCVQNKDLKNFS